MGLWQKRIKSWQKGGCQEKDRERKRRRHKTQKKKHINCFTVQKIVKAKQCFFYAKLGGYHAGFSIVTRSPRTIVFHKDDIFGRHMLHGKV